MTSKQRFLALRKRLIEKIHEVQRSGESGKFYEGRFEIRFEYPDAADCIDGMVDEPSSVGIHLDCYLVGPHRHYDWNGKTLEEVLDKCERDINKWMEEE